MANITQQAAEEFLQKLLAEMSPEDEQFMMQLLEGNKPAAMGSGASPRGCSEHFG